ncbi:MAG TPA: 5'/3'-nucleotidase SurE [Fimbriimonas sp.]|nr:5'/3'-nucleotidase SurE [Fimbriimonas sp.]
MRILITNDDGIRAPGLIPLVEVAKNFGEVKIVAPDRERSACAHAMTMRDPLRAEKFAWDGCDALEVNGFPADCVNVALTLFYPNGCDLVLSGINNGPNLGFDVTYSGTVAGAMEGTINGIRSIAVSMANFVTGAPHHYTTGARWMLENWEVLVNTPTAPLTFLNVNVPAVEYVELRGHRVVPMGRRVYVDRVEPRTDPWGRQYFWQGGVAVLTSGQPDTDVQVVSEGFVSISPLSLDWTNHDHVEALRTSLAQPGRAEA